MNVPIKILLVEDQRADAHRMLAMLKAASGKYPNICTHVATLAEGQQAKWLHDVVIADLHLPDSDGPETIAALAKEPTAPPVYVHSVSGDEALMVECGEFGALAFFPKDGDDPCPMPCLLPTLCTGIGQARRRRNAHLRECQCEAREDVQLEILERIRDSVAIAP